MQYQVPKFIDVEDKVFFGMLTIKQMIYFGAAFLFSMMAFYTFSFVFFVIFGVLLFGLATAFSFVKINGVKFSKAMRHALSFFWKPQVYIWRPKGEFLRGAEAAEDAGKSPQEILANLKASLKKRFAAESRSETQKKTGGAKILVDQPLIRGFEEMVREKR